MTFIKIGEKGLEAPDSISKGATKRWFPPFVRPRQVVA